MSNNVSQIATVATTLAAIMSLGVTGLASAVKTSHKLEDEIYANAATVAAIAAYRTGAAWSRGETADEKETKFNNAYKEFENKYIAAGNHTYRDSSDLKEFQNIAATCRKRTDNVPSRAQIDAYIAASKAAGFTRKEPAIAEVSRYAKKMFEDTRANHPGVIRDMAGSTDSGVVMAKWTKHIADTYGTCMAAVRAYFKVSGDDKAKADPIEAATEKLLGLTDATELAAIIKKLQLRADELTGSVSFATVTVNAATTPAAAPEAAPEDVAKAA
jgi:hypothetical protein